MSELSIFSVSPKDFEFLGFTFNGHHSSEFNLTVVAPSGLTESSLFAEFEDKIVDVSGKEGAYYFGTKVRTKSLNLTLAFDEMTSANKRAILSWLNPKLVSKLFLDEAPYKYYWVKVAAPPSFSFVPFEETEVVGLVTTKTHIFKGTIDVQLIASDPFAYSEYFLTSDVYVWGDSGGGTYTWINNVYGVNNVPGWFGESGLFTTAPGSTAIANDLNGYTLPTNTSGVFANYFYNGGDIETAIDFTIIITTPFAIGNVWTLTNQTRSESFIIQSLRNISALSADNGSWKIEVNPAKGTVIGSTSTNGYTNKYNLGALHNGVFLKVSPGNNTFYSDRVINGTVHYRYKYW